MTKERKSLVISINKIFSTTEKYIYKFVYPLLYFDRHPEGRFLNPMNIEQFFHVCVEANRLEEFLPKFPE